MSELGRSYGMDVYIEVNVNITKKENVVGFFWEITYIATEEKELLIKKVLDFKLYP